MHPYAVCGWKGALSGKTVATSSSGGKGEMIMVRRRKKVVSATKSRGLIDTRYSSSFKQKAVAKKFVEGGLLEAFGSAGKVKRYTAANELWRQAKAKLKAKRKKRNPFG